MTDAWSDALAQALADFDGVRVAPLQRFAADHAADVCMIAQLCHFAAADGRNLRDAATWLLKHYGVTGAQLTAGQTQVLLRLLLDDVGWLAQIHMLQLLDTLELPADMAAPLMQALERRAAGANTFMRAWSVHGAVVLADQHPAFRERALDLLAAAEQDTAPSVRARIRRTRQAFTWS